jgi:hypothetical protein
MFSKFLGSERFYIAPGLLLLSLSLAANYLQHMYYTKEIRRLVAVRKQLVHGQEVGEIELLPNHSSSEFNIEATE